MQFKKENEKIVQLICFNVGEEKFAVEISDINEINRFEHINRIPDMPPHFLGVIDLRGSVIPVVNLADKLGIQNKSISKDTRIIIAGFNNDKIGILVDGVSEVISTSISSLERPPSVFKRFDSEYVCGIIRNNNQLMVVLDLPGLFKDYLQLVTEPAQIHLEETSNNEPRISNDEYNNETVGKIVEVTRRS